MIAPATGGYRQGHRVRVHIIESEPGDQGQSVVGTAADGRRGGVSHAAPSAHGYSSASRPLGRRWDGRRDLGALDVDFEVAEPPQLVAKLRVLSDRYRRAVQS